MNSGASAASRAGTPPRHASGWSSCPSLARVAVVFISLYLLGTLYAVLGVTPLYGQGVSMGGHYADGGGHPMVAFTVELRSPDVGPLQLAATHSAIGPGGGRQTTDRTEFTLLAVPDWKVAPVAVAGIEASRVWSGPPGGGPCGGVGDPECPTDWYTGGVYGFGLSTQLRGARLDVRYLRHPGAPAAKGALIFLIGVDL